MGLNSRAIEGLLEPALPPPPTPVGPQGSESHDPATLSPAHSPLAWRKRWRQADKSLAVGWAHCRDHTGRTSPLPLHLNMMTSAKILFPN